MPAREHVYSDSAVTRVCDTEWAWRGNKDGRAWLVTAAVGEGQVHVEEGPEDGYARRHESGGNAYRVDEFVTAPPAWVLVFPGLHVAVAAALGEPPT
jgi:hypothetical protein